MRAIAANPMLEPVGCYAWSPEKVGHDVGELCGIDPLGVAATDSVDALLALRPDCVVYNPMWTDTDELVRILSAGVNVVTAAAFITGHNLGAVRDRIADACRRGSSTLLGTGISPGFGFLPPPDFEAETIADFMVIGHIITAMPAINAIPAVVAAEPGIATYNDLPLVLPRGVVSPN